MGLMDIAKSDAKAYMTDTEEWAVEQLWAVTNGVMVVSKTIRGTAFKHHLKVNDLGAVTNSKNARVTVHVDELEAAEYPYRDTNGAIKLLKHRVTFADVSGTQATYVVQEQWPNDMLGLVVCTLGDTQITTPGRLIIGWTVGRVDAEVVETPNPLRLQTLANGERIRVEYAANEDGTLTVPYMAGLSVLTPFMLDEYPVQLMPFNATTGTFDKRDYGGGFGPGNKLAWNAALPVYAS